LLAEADVISVIAKFVAACDSRHSD